MAGQDFLSKNTLGAPRYATEMSYGVSEQQANGTCHLSMMLSLYSRLALFAIKRLVSPRSLLLSELQSEGIFSEECGAVSAYR